MNANKLTEKARDAVAAAQEIAESSQHSQVEPEHLLLALLEQQGGVVPEIARRLGQEPSKLAAEARAALHALPRLQSVADQIYLSSRLAAVLRDAEAAAKQLQDD